MLIDGLAGSGGDDFRFWFESRGLGKRVGRVGMRGNPCRKPARPAYPVRSRTGPRPED